MRTERIEELWTQCLRRATAGQASEYVENPAIQFSAEAEAGRFDSISDEEYYVLLDECEDVAALWSNRQNQTIGNLLLGMLERTKIPEEQLGRLAAQFAECYVPSEPRKNRRGAKVPDFAPDFAAVFKPAPPAKIRDSISGSVIGQSEAVKAAAMITYHHLAGRRTNAVFCGPSGCGKSEIWRRLADAYPGLIRIVDFSRFSAEGWSGSLHLRNIFDGVEPSDLRRRGLIVVLDEADKILCEHAIGAGGTDYNAIVQNSLLKMLDGDVVEFGKKDGQPDLSVDCSRVSVVMLGAFERLLEGKADNAKCIGFGAVPKAEAVSHRNISHDDLINAGMRLEVAGRVDKIVVLDPLSPADYKAILRGPVLSGLEKSIGCRISITAAAAAALVEQSISSGLGVRWMKSSLRNAIDDAMFDAPEAESYKITVQGGSLCCRAQGTRGGGSGDPCADGDSSDGFPGFSGIPDDAWDLLF